MYQVGHRGHPPKKNLNFFSNIVYVVLIDYIMNKTQQHDLDHYFQHQIATACLWGLLAPDPPPNQISVFNVIKNFLIIIIAITTIIISIIFNVCVHPRLIQGMQLLQKSIR